ncbi:uncharacterized protein LOC124125550 [Haliotis rufescens]|uniref:uncharacterized protein LOC124125550 n=1 Tax=Haliotis rufescens TaxID=6454 RepID=UPI00201F5F5E|nr:uncharacterized protein LOC124125550 [Haliotis rufescens]
MWRQRPTAEALQKLHRSHPSTAIQHRERNMRSSIILLWLVVLVCVNTQDIQDSQDTQNTKLSRSRRSVKEIVEGLKTGFSRHLSSVFTLAKDKFKEVLSALGKLKLAVAKGILKKFIGLKDKQHDFGDAESAQRVAKMMEVLEEDIERQENGASASYVTVTSLTIPLLAIVTLRF